MKTALRRLSTLGATLGLAALPLVSACSAAEGPGADPLAMRVLTHAELEQAVLPQGDEKAVLVNFWATWCGPCIREMPELVELYEEWKDEGIRVQTISIDAQFPQGGIDTPEEVAAFMQEKGFRVPVIVSSAPDLTGLMQRFKLTGGIPVTLVLDRKGEIVARQDGAATKKVFRRLVERALGSS